MGNMIFSSPWIHHLNINAYSIENPDHSRSILQCHICTAKGHALDGETVWTVWMDPVVSIKAGWEICKLLVEKT